MNCPASSTISMSQRPRAAVAGSRTSGSVVVVMTPACARGRHHTESLLILVLPLPGYHPRWLESQQAAECRRIGTGSAEASVAGSYVTVGSGEHHVLAIHGWFGSARGWGSLPEFLDGSAYTYVFMNLRGYGDRKEVPGEFSIEEAAADALTVADDLGWDRFSVIGHSMGAQDRASGAAGGAGPGTQAGRPQPGAGRRGAHRRRGLGAVLWRAHRTPEPGRDHRLHHREQADQDLYQPAWCSTRWTTPRSTAFAAYLQAWAKSDFTAQAKVDTATPVKLIVGVNDPALSADVMEQTWLVFFPDAELTILPDAGHYPMFESPVSLATSIEEFLGRD